MVKRQDILDECSRRLGDTDPAFVSTILTKALDYVLLELSQEECLGLLRKTTSFPFNAAACVAANGLLNVNTQTLLSLPVGRLPERIFEDILVPEWGVSVGRICRRDDRTFEDKWLGGGTTAGRPRYYRVFPTLAQVQIWPAPDTTSLSATAILPWIDGPALIADSADITEIMYSDLGTLLSGLYLAGIKYRDEALNDTEVAIAQWEAGKQRMRERRLRAHHYGRINRIAYRDF